MTAFIATLEGEFAPRTYNSRRRYSSPRVQYETMSGLLDFGKSVVRATLSPITSTTKGITHMAMEAGRGVSTGDVSRILASPLKGVGHTVGNLYRDNTDHLEYYWRPSKMTQWQQPVGGALLAAAPFTGPVSPFLLAGGAALTVSGSIAGKIQTTHLERQAARQANSPEAQEARAAADKAKNKNYLWMGIGAAALVTAVTIMA